MGCIQSHISRRVRSHVIPEELVIIQSEHTARTRTLTHNDAVPTDVTSVHTPADTHHIHTESATDSVMSLLVTNPDSVPDVPCKDVPINVHVYDVYDGDTLNILMLSGGTHGTPIKLSIRILGIDTPEIRSAEGKLPEEKIAGKIARDRVAELLNARVSKAKPPRMPIRATLVRIIIRDWDKFGGRVLGDVFLPDGRGIADVMISEGYAREYHGDKKLPWTYAELTSGAYRR